uniref:(California timema) hypothetical protein n=1 Tax=Timema californicum TaxID=61474 RepID=A0A7R9JH71_TIMCA|nr:unnamed protein product [Timema californicum]
MQLLWQNNIPMCIEVLLCPDCPCGAQRAQCTEVSNMPAPSDILLEQWLVTAVTNRLPESPQMTVRGLFQAVRSQLHFSQLAAWWNNSKGSHPVNVSYRVTVSGEAFSSNFKRPPLEHSFPVAFVTRNTAINVSVRTLPRMEKVPLVMCTAHPVNSGEQGIGGGAIPKRNKSVEDQAWSVSKEQADQQLTESLLDPPPSLDLFARRYQSPSRCGSPSMEAPEYLMFGRGTRKQDGNILSCVIDFYDNTSSTRPSFIRKPLHFLPIKIRKNSCKGVLHPPPIL